MAKHQVTFSEHFPKLPPQNCIQARNKRLSDPGTIPFLESFR